jgi:putative motility protein YjfB-like
MDVTGIANLATSLSQAQTTNAIQVAVLKKALDAQEAGALALIQAIPEAPRSNPPNLGNAVDVFA